MTVRFERPVSLAARWARRIGIVSFLVTVAAWGGHRFGPLITPHLIIFLYGASFLAIFAIVLALIGLFRLWQVGAKGGKACFVALLAVTLPFSIYGFATFQMIRKPALYDVSTDIADPPQWLIVPDANQYPLPPRPAVTAKDRDAQMKAYPGLSGRRYEGAIDRILQAVRQVSSEQGIRVYKDSGLRTSVTAFEQDPAADEAASDDLEAAPTTGEAPVPTSRPADFTPLPEEIAGVDVEMQGEAREVVTGLTFDYLIRLREEAETTLVDLRVASRYGTHDLGLSAVMAETYLKKLDAVLLGLAGN
ncbi:MAG: hypothetical protein RIR97_1198 [Pseudomonadota bacterium]